MAEAELEAKAAADSKASVEADMNSKATLLAAQPAVGPGSTGIGSGPWPRVSTEVKEWSGIWKEPGWTAKLTGITLDMTTMKVYEWWKWTPVTEEKPKAEEKPKEDSKGKQAAGAAPSSEPAAKRRPAAHRGS